MSKPIIIAAGGTGGHFFPAEALATELAARGHSFVLMTDRRAGKRETGIFAQAPQYVLEGAGVAGKGIGAKLRGINALLRGAWKARRLIGEIDPGAVVGFGGYPSIPPLLGAWMRPKKKRPAIILHEGNAVLGQANALLARVASAIAVSYPHVARLPHGVETALTGMPVRPAIAALAGNDYTPPTESIRLLVWGGSLGARIFSDVVPAALGALPPGFRARLHVTQQARAEDVDRVQKAYREAGIDARVAPFLDNVPELLSQAHLVIGRAGGSSIAEVTLAGRPSILVPLPIAASDEQGANAEELTRLGGAWTIRQPEFTPQKLTGLLNEILAEPDRLAKAAQAAKSLARPGSAALLADLVESKLSANTASSAS
ncbi:undecaprenyldiphospho-muramoylpentapeptide beta-N-acetylglucosaminyltransferase [Kozakia baliensis]|uniref:UDP-N-acetylglucosamine--N-acetylmuramyl-(pentapeptide) pyrophosphoryl-undecaprenol N-acetylglucosamine transferase n=2 Tax=Kozakia baliensis TaxID=153496 RepID=A0A1D8UU23_9PROT|nr:undecaprenyldiphospho-muramoylpentapeptide beta-N-acetylglucosaminyltransferase [Kozakia baliensis]AOX17139.1 UDP-N-acetylglucosamine--N-acetylmuramyl-(pentapeptide) pyrophosphoryl-undecaprenol N-acetylglucosamine transferase [Kozakia baliensis]GEL64451.1 UDP-N-acetylglucosamine--N-acetylmuramyl-(pentapeptide) pyrophosphoryl-undecaprenol N-acetylglucosamine transferase [Kozakia baliensis]